MHCRASADSRAPDARTEVMLGRSLGVWFAIASTACTATPVHSAPRTIASATLLPQAILPADLDAVIWFDLTRLRDLWTSQPELQIARILGEYGVLDARPGEQDSEYWQSVLSRSDRLWVACRPSNAGCRDSVVLARGSFRDFEPRELLDGLPPAHDLGAGWFRYTRQGKLRRTQPARIYLAPPEQCLNVPLAELDSVERNLELGRGEPALSVEERGLLSMTLRGPAISDLVAYRSPSAARLLQDVDTIHAWLALNAQELELSIVAAFEDPQRAVRSGQVLTRLLGTAEVWQSLGASAAPTIQVVGRDVTIRLQLRAQNEATPPRVPGTRPAANSEPAHK